MRRVVQTAIVAGVLAIAAPPFALAQSPQPTGPWNGQNPFNCELQDVGTGTDFPHPEADPFCVEFDKTSQNVTDFGLIDFLSKEPARTAAASSKCFYFQSDHWTGSVVQGSDPELWHWDGHYFFDKAKGIGGVYVQNFRIGGQPQDPSQFAPPQYQPYFNDSGGGVLLGMESEVDPQCVAKVDTPAERRDVYRFRPRYPHCVPPGGEMRRRRVGGVSLGMQRPKIHERLGKPRRRKHHTDRYCLVGDAQLRIAYHGSAKHAAAIWTSARGHRVKDVGPGTRRRRAVRRLELEQRFRIRHTRVFEALERHGALLFAGIRHGRVRWLAITDARRLDSAHATRRALRRTS